MAAILFAATGLRAGELLGLEVRHFDGTSVRVEQAIWKGQVYRHPRWTEKNGLPVLIKNWETPPLSPRDLRWRKAHCWNTSVRR